MGNVLPWGNTRFAQGLIEENEKKRKERFAAARNKCEGIEEHLRNEILSLDFPTLRDSLQKDKYNAVTVLKAYAWKALQAQEDINCLAEFLIEAFEKAERMDVLYAGKQEKPVLYGLPFSVKGNFHVAGYDCCIGLTKYLSDPKTRDCTIVDFLHKNGAIPFVLTNIPQALLSFVCSNSVYGTTGNPKDPSRTPGGSSGGEGALLAYGGSVFGTGSDLAGSLRIPGSMCGVVALKPTEARFIFRHCVGGVPGRGRMALGNGYFTKNVDDHIFLLQTTWNSDYFHEYTPKHAPIPFRMNIVEEVQKKPLRIGYFLDDGFLSPAPGCARVVEETVEKLKKEGHELVCFKVPNPMHAADIVFKSIMTDGGTYLCKMYANDIVDKYMKQFVTLIKTPLWLRYMASFVVGKLSPQAGIMSQAYVRDIESLRQSQENVDEYTEVFTDMWNELQLDALICPAFAVPAVPHKYPSYIGACAFSTAFFNMLDYPAGVVPAGVWNDEDEKNLNNEKTFPVGRNFIKKFMREACQNSQGMPLAVQVVTKPFEEEKCLGVMKLVENIWTANTSLKSE